MITQARLVRFSTAATLGAALCGCRPSASEQKSEPALAMRVSEWLLPASAAGQKGECHDVGDFTACFDGAKARALPRALPNLAAPSALGFRCWEAANGRKCVDRLLAAGPFECRTTASGKAECLQRAPRQPRGGIWDCSDDAGVVVCFGQDAPPFVDEGWLCGERRHADAGQRVCVDTSPDYPDGRAEGWDCGFEDDARGVGGRSRKCVRDPSAHLVGMSCDAKRPCVAGTRCVNGACLPFLPRADCIADQDCDGGACRFGTCISQEEARP